MKTNQTKTAAEKLRDQAIERFMNAVVAPVSTRATLLRKLRTMTPEQIKLADWRDLIK